MADNYVELRIKATDTARPDVAGLKADLDELSHRAAEAKVDVDDEDGKLKLLELNAKLAELNRKVSRPRIDVAGAARAELQMTAIRAEMDAMDRKSDEPGPGILSKLLLGAKGAATGGPQLPLPMLGDVPLQALPVIAAAGAAALGAVLTELAGLVAGFTAAGAGAGAFAALAMPAVKNVSGAITKINTDQAAYDNALTKTARNTALAHLKQDWAALDPTERQAVKGVQSLTGEFGKLSKAFQPQAYRIFTDFLKIANNILPQVTPFANTFATALDGLLKNVDKVTAIPKRMSNARIPKHLGLEDIAQLRPPPTGWETFLNQLHQLEGPAVTAIGDGIGKVAGALSHLLTVMPAKDVVHALNIAFDALAGTIQFVTGFVALAMTEWDSYSTAFRQVRHAVATGAHDIATGFDIIRHAAATMAHDVAHWFDDIRGDVHRWYSDVVNDGGRVISWFGQLPHRIKSAVGNFGSLLFDAGRAVIGGLIHGIESMVGSVGNVMSSIGNEIKAHLPFSPAKKGPLSGAGAPENSGRSIARQLAAGLTSGLPDVSAAMNRVSGTVAAHGGGYGAYSATGGRPEIVLRFETGGGDEFTRWLRNQIRAKGGNVQVVLGTG